MTNFNKTIATLKQVDAFLDVIGYNSPEFKQSVQDSLKELSQGQSLPIDSVIVPKGTLLFHLKALTKKIEDSHCYGFEDILEDYIKSNTL